jgi:phage baseplate assembly protein W
MARDLLLEDGDLKTIAGDFDIGTSDQQHIEDILVASKGDYKQSPIIGVGLNDYINAPLTRQVKTTLEKEIRLQLQSDGFDIETIKVQDNGNLNIDAALDD